jgi:hypothetical protein
MGLVLVMTFNAGSPRKWTGLTSNRFPIEFPLQANHPGRRAAQAGLETAIGR